ncbi:MAG: ATP-binding cassette domain-containing protein [Clostridia bacterium]|nr:ATP-binding cassette domain-containing protein [Clostridia bacterium]
MLSLKDITKVYVVGDRTVNALRGVTAEFGDTGLVSILGQSGCGKTTLMNIIGGLDKATTGELTINGQSTASYTEKDWNTYRNNVIGFVFQTYHLIPHMNVVGNVELALTLSGVDAKERRARALEMLDRVGLKDQAFKKPNQLSGGQCQRVAIARALINNPTIILADEPTGAIDSRTSVQIMDILKEISVNCLIIMVTHNSELAEQYSDRIISMKDGVITDERTIEAKAPEREKTEEIPQEEPVIAETEPEEEAEPIAAEEIAEEIQAEPVKEEVPEEKPALSEATPAKKKKKQRASMSFLTAFKLSLTNLINKKGRTMLTVIAGSIGIICISLILAMNTGFSAYINRYESDSLSKYPIAIYSQSSSLMDMMEDAIHGGDIDVSRIDMNTVIDIFKEEEAVREKYPDADKIFLEKVILGIIEGDMENMGIKLDADISKFAEELNANYDPSWGTIRKDYGLRLNVYTELEEGIYDRINPLYDKILEQVGDSIPSGITEETKNQVKTMLDSLKTWTMMIDDKDVILNQYDVIAGHLPDYTTEEGMKEIVIVVDEYNQIDDDILLFLNKISITDFLQAFLLGSAEEVKQEFDFNEFIGQEYTVMASSDYYTYVPAAGFMNPEHFDYSATNEIIAERGTKIKIAGILRLKEGLTAGCIDGTIGYTQAFAEYIINKINGSDLITKQKGEYQKYLDKQQKMTEAIEALAEYGYEFSIEELSQMTQEEQTTFINDIMTAHPQEGMAVMAGMTAKIRNIISGEQMSTSDYEQLLEDLSVKDLNKPKSIYIYPTSIENKDKTLEFVNNFNAKINADPELANSFVDYTVTYTDDLSQITSSMKSMIDTITYILVAVAVLAVVVAMLLVAIILYISVQDRTKEIGILRSLGASKGNVSSVFIAETFIIGLISGIIGVVIGVILKFPANAIIIKVLGIPNLLQPSWWQCLALIGFSFITTVISGIIPSSLAAKKDPVAALRTD